MTYPGLPGTVGPPPTTTVGWQVRQSTAGSYPGGSFYTTAVDAMGGNAPASALVAERVTAAIDHARTPYPLEQDNFEAKGFRVTVDYLDGTAHIAQAKDTLDGEAYDVSSVDNLDGTAFDATSTG